MLKRSTWDFFYYTMEEGNDILTLLPDYFADFWYILILWILCVFVLYRFYPKPNNLSPQEPYSWRIFSRQTIGFAFLLGIFIIGSRGGIQLRPINSLTAVRYIRADQTALVTNTTFTLLDTYSSKRFDHFNFFNSEELSSIYTPEQAYITFDNKFEKTNVVVIILESFGAEYSQLLSGNQNGYTPFLDSLMQHSLTFRRGYANAKKSIEALPAILSGIPALMDNPFITSPYNSNLVEGIPSILKRHGYSTWFFHGGPNGTMGFDNFSQSVGVDHYLGKQEYVGCADDYDGSWGIYDEPYLQYVANILDSVPKPFFAGIFTLSSHHPYKIPQKYENLFADSEHPILKSVAYTDFALNQFFSRIEKTDWFRNTLFVITADHTSISFTPQFANMHGSYRVPIVFYYPGNPSLKRFYDYPVQQTDIFPSVIHLLGLSDPIVAYGSSVFTRDTGWAVSYLNNIYQITTDSLLIQFDGHQILGIFNPIEDPLLQNDLKETVGEDPSEITLLKAIMQDFRYRMKNNKLTSKWPSKE
ncbi:MAG TPA: sulfatase-like hydrolase/transferase [Salinivirgaceae bacterium]|nr:sulfatase-like hydrolase/transferase [Salinivirgaceae bacterium]